MLHFDLDLLFSYSIPHGNLYGSVGAFVGNVLNPMFKSFYQKSRGERDGDKLGSSVEKSLADVEIGLLHLQQNIDIPDINLMIHPQIEKAIARAKQENRRATVSFAEHTGN